MCRLLFFGLHDNKWMCSHLTNFCAFIRLIGWWTHLHPNSIFSNSFLYRGNIGNELNFIACEQGLRHEELSQKNISFSSFRMSCWISYFVMTWWADNIHFDVLQTWRTIMSIASNLKRSQFDDKGPPLVIRNRKCRQDQTYFRFAGRMFVSFNLTVLFLGVAKLETLTITGYYGRLGLLTRGDLTDPSLNFLFTKTTAICETMETIR